MKITIIGAAGCVGSATAFYISARGLADEIVMIGGNRQNVLLHQAMDISTAVAAQDTIVRVGTYEDLPGSDIVINAAGAHHEQIASRIDMLSANRTLLIDIARNIYEYCPEAVVITATNPVDPLNYAMYLLSPHRNRNKLIGYSRNDSLRFQILLSQSLDIKASQIEGIVIGEHGQSQVLLFSSIRVNEKPINISEKVKQDVRQKMANIIPNYEKLHANRTAGWTTAVGLAAECQAIIQNAGKMIPCSVVMDGEYGIRGLSMGVPVILGRDGIQKILEWQLTPDEQQGLDHSINTIQPSMQYVEKYLGMTLP